MDPDMPVISDARIHMLTTLPIIFPTSATAEPRCGVPKKTIAEKADIVSPYRWSFSCARTSALKVGQNLIGTVMWNFSPAYTLCHPDYDRQILSGVVFFLEQLRES